MELRRELKAALVPQNHPLRRIITFYLVKSRAGAACPNFRAQEILLNQDNFDTAWTMSVFLGTPTALK